MDRLINGLTGDNAGRYFFYRVGQFSVDLAFAVNGVTQRIDNATNQLRAYRNFKDTTGTFSGHTFFKLQVVTQDNSTHGVTLQVQYHAENAVGEFNHFTKHRVFEAVNFHDTVGNADDGALITGFRCDVKLFNSLLDDVADLGRIQLLHAMSLRLKRSALRKGGSIDHAPTRQ